MPGVAEKIQPAKDTDDMRRPRDQAQTWYNRSKALSEGDDAAKETLTLDLQKKMLLRYWRIKNDSHYQLGLDGFLINLLVTLTFLKIHIGRRQGEAL
tara:strand:- start:317 stop:607 length:291 start_codon:yes stop_codon:yes gene_type:complete